MLAATCQWFHRLIMEESIWKFACLRDLQVPHPGNVGFKWFKLYATAFGTSLQMEVTLTCSISRRNILDLLIVGIDASIDSRTISLITVPYHITPQRDWMRIGAFFFDSPVAFLTENLIAPRKIPQEETLEKMLQLHGCCVLNNIKTGIWIAGTMQTLDARHIELFLNEGYKDGSWEYNLLGSQDIKKHTETASGGIFDIKHLKDPSNSDIFDLKKWVGKHSDWQPKAMITLHAAAVNTNLQENEGIHVKYHAMRAGDDGKVVSIRISQQLL
ncbi:unnamed protein product [Ilex paraguariensis]|uniref:F-box protein n=1 Tax=Ilex paraguariensis TaxID=185542 RepID=A0ABC8T8N3_9AQUA